MDPIQTRNWDIVEHNPKIHQQDKKIRLSQIIVEGHIKKWLNVVRGWKRCYFSLRNGVFKYSHKQKEIEEKAILVNLTHAMISKERSKTSCRFVIDTGTLIMNLRAKTSAERETWVLALVETKELLSQLYPLDTKENVSHLPARLSPRHQEVSHMEGSSPRSSITIDPHATLIPNRKELPNRKSATRHIPSDNSMSSVEQSERPNSSISNLSSSSNEHLSSIGSTRDKFQEKLQSLGKIKQQLNLIEEGGKKKKFAHTHAKINKEEINKLREELVEIVNALTNDTMDLILDLDNMNLHSVVEKTENKKPIVSVNKEIKKESPRELKQEKEGVEKYTKTSSDVDSEEEYFDAEDDVWNEEESSSLSQSANDFFSIDLTESQKKKTPDPKIETPIVTPTLSGEIVRKVSSRRSRRNLVASLKSIKVPLPRSEKTPGVTIEDILNSVPDSFRPRSQLPFFRDDSIKLNIAKFLKDAIGKDLTRISMPVILSEPLSLLQRLAEEYASYSEVLDKAAKSNDAALRLAYVASFAVSCYASTPDRLYKPFNSILGETYELIDKQKRWRLLTEQVSHHPPVSACICEGTGWTIWGHAEVKTKFWGKSLEITPVGSQTVNIPHTGDQFVWNKVTTIINNIILGSKWVDHYGEMIVINQTTGDKCKLNFEKTVVGWLGSAVPLNPKVTGVVYDKINHPKYKIEGTWTDFLDAIPYTASGDLNEKNKIRLWERSPWPTQLKEQYNYTSFAIAENELPAHLRPYLPITDSRWRTDQRAFENGDFDLAQEEKTRMEEVQRKDRITAEANNIVYQAKWFRLDKDSNTYVYKGGYWEQRMKMKWVDPSNVFGLDLDSEGFQHYKKV